MPMVLDARARAWLRRLPRPDPYSLAELVLMAAVSVQVARFTWAVLTPVAPVGDWRPVSAGFAGSQRALFTGYDPFTGGVAGATPAVANGASLVKLTLFGTRLDGGGARGSAIIAGPDGLQKSVAVGEEIMPGVLLRAVAFDHVTVDRGGLPEDVFLPKLDAGTAALAVAPPASLLGAPAAPVPSAPLVTSPAPIGAAQLRTDIGFVPRLDGVRLTGLVVRPQASGAAFHAAGLQDGDVVVQIDGRPVTGPADLDRAVTSVSRGGVLGVTVDRGGIKVPLAITIAGQ